LKYTLCDIDREQKQVLIALNAVNGKQLLAG